MPKGNAWWTASHGRTRQSQFLAGVIGVALMFVSYVIWTSPTGSTLGALTRPLVGAKPAGATAGTREAEPLVVTTDSPSPSASASRSAKAKAKATGSTSARPTATTTSGVTAPRAAGAAGAAGTLGGGTIDRSGANVTRSPGSSPDPSPDPSRSQGASEGTSPLAPSPVSPPAVVLEPSQTPSPSPSATLVPGTDDLGDPNTGGDTNPQPTQAPVPVTAQIPTKAALINPDGRYFGLYTTDAPGYYKEYDQVAAAVGATPTITGYFGTFDEDFRADKVTRAWAHGTLPLLTWESWSSACTRSCSAAVVAKYSPTAIADGDWDAYLTKYAQSIAALKLPLVIRFDHEMNGDWYPWSKQSGNPSKSDATVRQQNADAYVAMWQHVHDVFQAYGANDYVIWNWAPNIKNNLRGYARTTEYLDAFYPGGTYVDWTGLSGYFRAAKSDPGNYTYTYDQTLHDLGVIAPTKKALLAEVGATERESEAGGTKVGWLKTFLPGLAQPADPERPDVVGFVWFNLSVANGPGGAVNDWRLNSSDPALAAFRSTLDTPGLKLIPELIQQ